MKSPIGSQTSTARMIRTGWVISGLTSTFLIGDGLAKALFPPKVFFLEEVHRLLRDERLLRVGQATFRNFTIFGNAFGVARFRIARVRKTSTASSPPK